MTDGGSLDNIFYLALLSPLSICSSMSCGYLKFLNVNGLYLTVERGSVCLRLDNISKYFSMVVMYNLVSKRWIRF